MGRPDKHTEQPVPILRPFLFMMKSNMSAAQIGARHYKGESNHTAKSEIIQEVFLAGASHVTRGIRRETGIKGLPERKGMNVDLLEAKTFPCCRTKSLKRHDPSK